MISVMLNGEPATIPQGLSVRGLLAFLKVDGSRVAVEVNRSIVRKSEWDSRAILAGEEVEVVHFVGGGRQ
jgi:thiamine biosynthesis protein ThiS